MYISYTRNKKHKYTLQIRTHHFLSNDEDENKINSYGKL